MKPFKNHTSFDETPLSEHLDLEINNPHIESVTVLQGPRITQIVRDGTHEFKRADGASMSGRGSTVCITFFTEDGQRVFLTYQFHKGEVYANASMEPIEDWGVIDPETGEPNLGIDLWRN
jgi:hypothetical protein